MSSVLQQIEAFTSGTASEFAFPADLSVEERKLVKIEAEKLGLSSQSFGMGSERRIHIFKPASSRTIAPEPVKYSVKNTFIEPPDAWTPAMEQALVAPAHQSMPVGALQIHIAEEKISAASLLKVTSPRDSEADTDSPKDSERPLLQDSDSESQDAPPISIKNSFVHFEDDSKEHVDPRIIQSMPAGTFGEKIEEERVLAASAGHQKRRPSALSDDIEAETERSSSMLFPSTPNADNQMSFDTVPREAVPVVHCIPASTTALGQCSVTVLPPAMWTAPAPAPSPARAPSSAQGPPPPQGPPEGMPQGSALPMPNADNQMNFDTGHREAVPVAHCIPVSTTALGDCSMTVLPPAMWTAPAPALAPAPAPAIAPSPALAPSSAQGPPAVPLQGSPEGTPHGSALPMPPQAAPPPPCFVPGTPVVLQGLSNQSNFNGLPGVVSSFDADCGRYNVMIEIGPNGPQRLVKVKFQNLILRQPSVPQPPCCSPVHPAGGMAHPAKAALVLDRMV